MSEKIVVEDVIRKEDIGFTPILVDFQNGALKGSNVFKNKFIVANNKNAKRNEAIFSIDKNIYRGVIKENRDQQANSYIVIKRDNKIRIIEVDQCTLIHDVHSQKSSTNSFNNKELAMRVLMKNFGGKKSKIYFERTERAKVNLGAIKSQLNQTVDESILQEDNDKVNEIEIIPPFNKDAKTISDVYCLTNILETDFLISLEEEAAAVYSHNTKDLPISSEFILKEVDRAKSIKPKSECLTLLKVLIYLDALLNYIKIKKRNIDGVELSKISDKISKDIRRRFSPRDSSKLIRTITSVDKAICYFIVLIILIQPNLELDINILTTEIGRPKNKIKSSCNIAYVKQKQYSDILSFSLPDNVKSKPRTLKRKTL